MSNRYRLRIQGERDQTFYSPAGVREEIEELVGRAAIGREHLLSRLERMKAGETFMPMMGVLVTVEAMDGDVVIPERDGSPSDV